MPSPNALITDRIRERVRADGVVLDAERAAGYVREEVRRYSERALGGTAPLIADEARAEREILAALTGFGPLQPLLDDPTVEEVWINAPDAVFVARGGRSERTSVRLGEGETRDLVERMLASTGRRVDLSSPFVDASLPDGSRLHVVIPDVTRSHWSVNIRKFSSEVRDLGRLVELGSLTRPSAEFLRMAMLVGATIIVSGATQSGKTTLLGALLAAARPSDRIVTVEETFELAIPGADWVAMQCRQPSLEGTGEITLRRLVKEALRMRPDRLVVGEVREAEALDLLIALNAGLPGLSSIHANGAREALDKLATLPLLAGRNIDAGFIVPAVASSVDAVVQCDLLRDGRRRVREIHTTTGRVQDGRAETVPVFETRAGLLRATGAPPGRLDKFVAAGLDPAIVIGADE